MRGDGTLVPFEGRLPVRLRLIVTVKDTGNPVEVVKMGGIKDDEMDDIYGLSTLHRNMSTCSKQRTL